MTVPCGQCIGCRLERSRQWAIRCVHEYQMHDEGCFITLTYDDDFLPYGASLYKPDFQNFMKRLRKKLPQKIRYFMCGEYGDTTQRPHYHALVFGWRPDDPGLFTQSGEFQLYDSKTLTDTWGMGHASFGEITFETAAYTARYVTKKITGDAAAEHYSVIDSETGEIFERLPEYSAASRDPAIGASWLTRYGRDAYEKDEVVMRAQKMRPPRAYDQAIEVLDPRLWQTVRAKRERDRFRKYVAPHHEAAKYFRDHRDPGNKQVFHPSPQWERNNAERRLYSGQRIAEARLQQRSQI